MNEQNNNGNIVPNPQQPATAPTAPVTNVAPTQEVPTPSTAPAPVATTAPAPVSATPVVTPAAPSTPVTPTTVPVPAAPVTPAPVAPTPAPQPAPIATPAPVAAPQPVEQPVVPQTPAPVPTDIVPSEPINPIANNATVAQATPTTAPTLSPTQPQPMTPPAGANTKDVGFVPNGTPLEKKKNPALVIIIVVAILAILAVVGIFVVYPYIVKKTTTPKMVYEVAIQSVAREINTTVNDIIHDRALIDVSLGIDSNMETISSFSGYTYGFNSGVDSSNKTAQIGLYMKNSSAEYSLYEYIKDGKKYSRYSTDNQLNFLGEMTEEETNEIFASFKEAMESQENISSEDVNYIINKASELLISSLDESKLSREETTLKINNENIKVLNNKYVIDEATAETMEKHILDGLKADDKTVAILAKIMKTTEDDIKEILTYSKDDETEEDEEFEEEAEEESEEPTTITMSIYTNTKLNKVIGYAITDNTEEVKMHYYNTEDYFELEVYTKSEDIETNKDIENKFNITGVVKEKATDVTITSNGKKVMTLAIKENTDTKLDLSYEVFGEENSKVTGTLKINIDDNGKRNKTDFEFTMKAGEQYINVELNTTLDWTSDIANINTGNAVQVTEAELLAKETALRNQINQTPIGILLQTISGDMSNGVEDYYDESYNSITVDTEITDNTDVIITPDNVDTTITVDNENHIN